MLSKIISGGQTGADRAALDAGLEKGFPIGGSCPKGRLAEDGPIDAKYPLHEIAGGYADRTRRNVEDSDGTLIFYDRYLRGGTEQTAAFCIEAGKPYKLIDMDLADAETAAEATLSFLDDCGIAMLNVAGPRHSGSPAIYGFVKKVTRIIIEKIAERRNTNIE